MGAPITRYEICVIDDDGVALPFEATDGPALRWRVRGLAFHHRYGLRVRAVNSAGTGPQTPLVYATPIRPAIVDVPPGQRIPLLDLDRQSLIVRLAGARLPHQGVVATDPISRGTAGWRCRYEYHRD